VKPAKATHRRTQRDGPRRFCPARMIEMLRTADGGELMRRLAGGMLQAGVDAETTAHIGAGVPQRTEARTTQRNSTRDKVVMTAAGELTVKIAKARTGSFFPAKSAKAANTCQPTPPRPSHNHPHANRPAGRRTGRTLPARPSHHFSPTDTDPAASARCPGSSLTSSAQEYLSPQNLTDRAGRSPPSDRGEHRCGQPDRRWSGFALPAPRRIRTRAVARTSTTPALTPSSSRTLRSALGALSPARDSRAPTVRISWWHWRSR